MTVCRVHFVIRPNSCSSATGFQDKQCFENQVLLKLPVFELNWNQITESIDRGICDEKINIYTFSLA